MIATWLQWIVFILLAFISLSGALGMATTMSMFRSGIFLMASFIGVAGLFILLLADLVALLQVMMYIGGMLVMILFMVMFSHDPGGAMMAGMDMSSLEKVFSRGLPRPDMEMDMDMQAMSMTTPLKKWAALAAILIGLLLSTLVLFRSPWPSSAALPRSDAPAQVGFLLMGKYMLAFEGAGLLILLGIFAAVWTARPGSFPDRTGRDQPVAVDAPPVPIDMEPLETELPAMEPWPPNRVGQIHCDSEEKP